MNGTQLVEFLVLPTLFRDEILKFIAGKATVTSRLDGDILAVETIGKPGTGAWNNGRSRTIRRQQGPG